MVRACARLQRMSADTADEIVSIVAVETTDRPTAVAVALDAKKYARREEFQQRARELLALIDRYVTASPR